MDNTKNNNEYLVEQYQLQRQLGNLELANEYMAQIINKNKPMVHKIVNKNCNNSGNLTREDKEDMQQEGMIALMNAAMLFDVKQASFSTFAYQKVSYAIKDWLRANHIISIPNQKQSACRAYITAIEEYREKDNSKTLSESELASNLKVGMGELIDIQCALSAYQVDSLNKRVKYGAHEYQLGDTIMKDDNSFNLVDLKIDLEVGLSRLNEREQQIIRMYYFEGLGLAEIAKRYEATPQYVSKVKKQAVKRLERIMQGEKKERGIAECA